MTSYANNYPDHNLSDPSAVALSSIVGIRPPNRIKVSESARRMILENPGGYCGPWDPETVPYMIEPMDCLTSRVHDSVIFVGPQRTGKTVSLFDAWIYYSVCDDPADMLFIFPAQDLARDFSLRRLNRLVENNEQVRRAIIPGHGDNVYDKQLFSGAMISLGWPSPTQLRQRDAARGAVTELDNIKDDISGGGDLFSLLRKRSETYKSAGMTLAEGCPVKPIGDIRAWAPPSDHWPYPAPGLAKLYSEGDRRRWYWQCRDCGGLFQAAMRYMQWDDLGDALKSSKTARMVCPHCGAEYSPKHKTELNASGVWRPDVGASSTRASFWLEGPAAGFQTWPAIVYRQLAAMEIYEKTGDSTDWKTTVSSDQGLQFVDPARAADSDTSVYSERAESWERGTIPAEVKFLTCAIDQQKDRFVVQVEGWGEGRQRWIIERKLFTHSTDKVGEDQKAARLSPSTCPEDWDVLLSLVDDSWNDPTGRTLKIRRIGFDIGGQGKATENAYAFWRKAKRAGHGRLFKPLKGDPRLKAARIKESKADAAKRGSVPLWIVSTDMLKDELSRALQREDVGDNYIHFPDWLGDWFYKELDAEERTPQGWRKRGRKVRNEAFDLCAYNLALAIDEGIERINWANPPQWITRQASAQASTAEQKQVAAKSKLLERLAKLGGGDVSSDHE